MVTFFSYFVACCINEKNVIYYQLEPENNFTFTLMTTRTFSWTISKLFSELKLVTDNLFFIDQRLEHSKGNVKASCLVNSRLMNTKFVSYNWLGIPLLLPCLCSLLWPNLPGIPSPFFAFCKWSKIGSLVPRSCPKSQEFDPDHTCKFLICAESAQLHASCDHVVTNNNVDNGVTE